ncbi:hypothetical protein [Heyndrickxia coagulans]|uniref:Uncharacterized protein n=2 Tax=Heyndrickxia coagulans TaxID=1398 RepID=A0A150K8D9_HEYCO|nr:hypothetical protein [Heyndrickxia coagulans]AJH79668.1 putative small, acid-soluble spore protein N [Heyndrickxia coagulans DSM 1 = ATCC 7050]KYC65869.1 hypothetical protein B4099_3499 [Heyndrickxia coagulans]MBF8418263.1 hypothetical protein [Heyndrickxia coagulans]MCR2845706.1 hypothetical protein [Heyndrickxia coagulans]MDR4223281.1 hypothetical protein [Heyndrickxia coagulans DSM 1 = ATCC 7050]
MPYHKDKQQAFQAAGQHMALTEDILQNLDMGSEDAGHQLAHLKEEINETYQEIENALEVASETQRVQLEQFRRDLDKIVKHTDLH